MTPSMAVIVGGARKYRVGLTLAHQELRQLQQDFEVGSAVLSNSYTRVVFRVGDDDARKLADGFAFFEARDLQNLPIGQAICRVERSDFDFNLTVPRAEEQDQAAAAERRRRITTVSRERYGTARADVEALLAKQAETPPQAKPVSPTPPPVAAAPTPPIVPKASEAPQPAEVPKSTGSGKEPLATLAKHEPPRDLGRGGAQHKAIQERIQTEAHTLGFFAAVEGQLVEKSNQAADVVLRKEDLAIAVEITVTTTTDHEFGNVKKCLMAGFTRVAVVSPSPERLKAIAEAVNAGLDATGRSRVSYHTPDEFMAWLRQLAANAAPPTPVNETELVTRGYTVRRHGPKLSPKERKASEDAAIRVIAATMKRKS
jgi:hypothetical protein